MRMHTHARAHTHTHTHTAPTWREDFQFRSSKLWLSIVGSKIKSLPSSKFIWIPMQFKDHQILKRSEHQNKGLQSYCALHCLSKTSKNFIQQISIQLSLLTFLDSFLQFQVTIFSAYTSYLYIFKRRMRLLS